MSIRKVHLVKQDELVTERGVQLRPDNPTAPSDNQLWINKSDKRMYFRSNNQTIPLNATPRTISEIRTITQSEALSKKIDLEYEPILETITLVPDGGPPQHLGNDFDVVNDTELSWSGFGLDGLIEKDDILYITYTVKQ
jgi:hypothetical protein